MHINSYDCNPAAEQNPMVYQIVKRAFSNYETVETVTGWLNAMQRADQLQFTNNDGEYFVKKVGETDKSPAPYTQSGFDYL